MFVGKIGWDKILAFLEAVPNISPEIFHTDLFGMQSKERARNDRTGKIYFHD